MKYKFVVAYIFNDKTCHEGFDTWIKAMERYWKLISKGVKPTVHFQ